MMGLAIALLTLPGAAGCPQVDDVLAELREQGVVLAPELELTVEPSSGASEGAVDLSLRRQGQLVESREVAGATCADRTRAAAAFAATWALMVASPALPPRLSPLPPPPPPLVWVRGPAPPALLLSSRITADPQLTIGPAGLAFQGVLEYGLGGRVAGQSGSWLLTGGAMFDVSPDVPFQQGVVKRRTVAACASLGFELRLGALAFSGGVGALAGPGFLFPAGLRLPLETNLVLETAGRLWARLRLLRMPWLPLVSAAFTLWPGRQPASAREPEVQREAPAPLWQFSVGLNFALVRGDD